VLHTGEFEVILLVGLTEPMAQIGWIDSITLSPQEILSWLSPFLVFVVYGSGEKRTSSESRFLNPSFPKLNFAFRNDAIVMYDDPQSGPFEEAVGVVFFVGPALLRSHHHDVNDQCESTTIQEDCWESVLATAAIPIFFFPVRERVLAHCRT